MKTLTPEYVAEKKSAATSHCVAIKIGTNVRLSNWDVSISIDGEDYLPGFPIETPKIRTSKGGNIKVGNTDDVFSSLLINHELNNSECSVMDVFFQEDFTIAGVEVLFDGVIDGPYINLGWAVLPLGLNRIEAEAPVPRRRLMAACGFGFKFPSCGYIGVEGHCMKTRETCRNPGRFAGFRFIPPPGKKFVWGGTVYKVVG